MPQLIEDSLNVLDAWYNEPSVGNDRPKLLSKLALLELCGWIEESFDKLIRNVDLITINDNEWVNNSVIKRTNGFTYLSHFRPMLVTLVGEFSVRRIESEMQKNCNGELERMKSLLGTLWDKRCNLAHADVGANVAAQIKFDAPSWSINQYRILGKYFISLEKSIKTIMSTVQ